MALLRIKEHRDAREWSQEDLARELGVSVFTVSRWERGTHPPPLERLGDIAAVLGVRVADLLERDGVA